MSADIEAQRKVEAKQLKRSDEDAAGFCRSGRQALPQCDGNSDVCASELTRQQAEAEARRRAMEAERQRAAAEARRAAEDEGERLAQLQAIRSQTEAEAQDRKSVV